MSDTTARIGSTSRGRDPMRLARSKAGSKGREKGASAFEAGAGAWAAAQRRGCQNGRRRGAARREGEEDAYFRRSRIFASPARAQLSSNLAPGAPAAPIEPIVSSPILMTIPPPKNMTCGSLASGAMESSPFARSAKARVSFLNETLVYALSCALSRVCMPAPSPRSETMVVPSASSTTAVSR